jgi:predicted esterase YcpF (UPF0227 family)
MLVIYFHGFASNPNTSKVKILQDSGFNVVAPSINIDPAIADVELKAFIKETVNSAVEKGESRICFVGTSLGGFWAARMCELFDGMAVLINPAMHPEDSLKQYIGEYKDFGSDEVKTLTAKMVDSYKNYSAEGSDRYRYYFIASKDPVVTPHAVDMNATYYDSDDHQGLSFFPDVIEFLNKIS